MCLLERLDREEKISDEAVPFTASQEILSTRSSMAINGKMLLGTLICFVIAWYSNPPNNFIFVAIAWVRHTERILFHKFPEVVFMDFTGYHTCLFLSSYVYLF